MIARVALLVLVVVFPSAATAAEPVRLMVVGLTHDHVFWLLHRPRDRGDVQIVSVVEPDEALARKRLEGAGIAPSLWRADLRAAIRETRPEAACLFGSIREHRDAAIACAEAGVHVMVEKPLAIDLPSADAMAEAARRGGVHLLTNYETTWSTATRSLGERLRASELSRPRRMVFRMGHGGPVEIGCRDPFLAWLLDPAENGAGALTDFGCYGVNLATWFMRVERPTAVTASVATRKPELYPRVDDDATITLHYPDAVALIQASWNWPRGIKETRVTTAEVEVIAEGDRLTIHRGDEKPRDVPPDPLPPADADPFAHLAAVVRGEREPNALSSLENNRIVVEVLDAARRSAATGERVELTRPVSSGAASPPRPAG